MYHLIEYIMGEHVEELTTDNKKEAQQFYNRSFYGNCTVRVYKNGEKLTYADADREFKRPDWVRKETLRWIN